MIATLNKDANLKGYSFEYIARIILRRSRQNNFIFLSNRFDSIDEIISKYRLTVPENLTSQIELFRNDWKRFDLIEFKLNSNKERIITNITIFDVKTKNHYVARKYFESCLSNHKFLKKCKEFNIEVFIISIILFKDWKFSFNLIDYFKAPIRVYSRFINK